METTKVTAQSQAEGSNSAVNVNNNSSGVVWRIPKVLPEIAEKLIWGGHPDLGEDYDIVAYKKDNGWEVTFRLKQKFASYYAFDEDRDVAAADVVAHIKCAIGGYYKPSPGSVDMNMEWETAGGSYDIQFYKLIDDPGLPDGYQIYASLPRRTKKKPSKFTVWCSVDVWPQTYHIWFQPEHEDIAEAYGQLINYVKGMLARQRANHANGIEDNFPESGGICISLG